MCSWAAATQAGNPDRSAAAAPPAAQLAVLGLIFLGLALVLDLTYALAGGAVATLVASVGRAGTWLRWPVAGIYVRSRFGRSLPSRRTDPEEG